ncbi:MAG TPA: tyrosine-type recombinase/integrase [Ktedonobacterales bacterium]
MARGHSSDEHAAKQPSLFAPEARDAGATPSSGATVSLVEVAPLTPTTTLAGCALAYAEHLRRTDHSGYTITCFLSDLRMLTEFLGKDVALGSITTNDLGDWLAHLRFDGASRPAPKTIARRITFLRNFFGWVASGGIVPADPSAQIALMRPLPPLPELLFDDEIARLREAASVDPRAHLLVLLLLATGLKKEEVMGLGLRHIDISDPAHPAVEVHFPGAAKRRRERRMELPPEWTAVYQAYVERYQPRERLFECTDRNLNYVLAAAVKRANLQKRVTLQLLRDIFAVRQLRAGASLDELREKLGLSDEAWYETAEKYRKLAFPA